MLKHKQLKQKASCPLSVSSYLHLPVWSFSSNYWNSVTLLLLMLTQTESWKGRDNCNDNALGKICPSSPSPLCCLHRVPWNPSHLWLIMWLHRLSFSILVGLSGFPMMHSMPLSIQVPAGCSLLLFPPTFPFPSIRAVSREVVLAWCVGSQIIWACTFVSWVRSRNWVVHSFVC